jgi:ubiquinone/menaquinone biosynthesis C-methylase UbiE
MNRPDKKLTFRFFDYKWKRVPNWARATEGLYQAWYLKRYGYGTKAHLRSFLHDKDRILEAGCGLARDSKMFAELNSRAEIVAMDQSPSALKVARKTLQPFRNCRVVRGDVTRFDGEGLFDFISCDQVLHHTPIPAKTLQHLYNHLVPGGVLNFFVCRKKNPYRDHVDDLIMDRARSLSPAKLWKFADVVTRFGQALYELGIGSVTFSRQRYENLQRFVHNQVFRCWYNPDIDFALSVSSNYDWFSGNPRFDASGVRKMMKQGLGPHKILRFFEDDASISVSIRKSNA